MTEQAANAILEREKPLDLHSEHLVGYERISADVAPHDTVGRIALAKMIQDCDGTYGTRRIPYKLSIDASKRLSLWTLPPQIEPR